MAGSIVLTQEQKATLQTYLDSQDYPGGYRYLKAVVEMTTDHDPRVANWLEDAAKINRNDGSLISEFVRGATLEAGADAGTPITLAEFQDASNQLAQHLLTKMVTRGEILPLDEIISEDVSAAVNQLGLGIHGWAGTFGAIFPVGLGGLGLQFDSPFYKYLYQDFRESGPKFYDYITVFFDVLENNIQGVAYYSEPELQDAYSKIQDVLGATYDQISESMQNANAAVAQASNTVVQQRLYDPLVADLDGNGIEMVGLQNSSVFFDLDTSNPGLEHTGWVSPKDGFFAIRPEGGQPIKFDNLLGNDTIDGFDELRRYDENGDRVMNASDPVFSNGTLVMWQDSNQNGVSSPNELTTMAERNITSIDLNERRGLIEENHGNIIIADSTMVMNDQTRRIADVLLLVDGFNTISNPANSTGSLNPETLFLPYSRGYSLHVA
jgi:hypothetical protein